MTHPSWSPCGRSRPPLLPVLPGTAPFAALLLTLTLSVPALAHEYWLAPSTYLATQKAQIEFGAGVGTGFRGERKPFSAARCVRFIARGERVLDFVLTARENDPVWARFSPIDGGGLMVGYESNFLPIELPAAEFDAYLAMEGLEAPLAARRKLSTPTPGRERYRRCAKTWIAGADDRRAVKALDLPLELVPQSVPGADKTLKLKVVFEGKSLRGVLVRAWRTPLATNTEPTAHAHRDSAAVAWEGRTDSRGVVTVNVAEPGEWLVSAVHMAPSRDAMAADWESTWASLTFARFGAAPARTGELRGEDPGRR